MEAAAQELPRGYVHYILLMSLVFGIRLLVGSRPIRLIVGRTRQPDF